MSEIDRRLEEMSDDLIHKLTCPKCDADLSRLDIVEILAPDEVEKQSVAAFKSGMGGAGIRGILGSIAGPAGTAAGISIGGWLGGNHGSKKAELKRVKVQCPHCGCEEQAA